MGNLTEYIEIGITTNTFGNEYVAYILTEITGEGVSVFDAYDYKDASGDYSALTGNYTAPQASSANGQCKNNRDKRNNNANGDCDKNNCENSDNGNSGGGACDCGDDLDVPPVIVKGYIEKSRFGEIIDALIARLEEARGEFGSIGSLDVEFRVITNDWRKEWKKAYAPIPVGALTIRPVWEVSSSDDLSKTIVIDPGLAFGTGQHETTAAVISLIQGLDPRNAVGARECGKDKEPPNAAPDTPMADEPLSVKPLTEKSLKSEPLINESLSDKYIPKKSLSDKPSKKSLPDESLMDKSISAKPSIDKSISTEPSIDESSSDKYIPKKSLSDKPAEKSLSDESLMDKSISTEPLTAKSCGLDLTGRVVFDVGCGSGILGVAALRLGARAVCFFDNDDEAVRCATENLAHNRFDGDSFKAYADVDSLFSELNSASTAEFRASDGTLCSNNTVIKASGSLRDDYNAVFKNPDITSSGCNAIFNDLDSTLRDNNAIIDNSDGTLCSNNAVIKADDTLCNSNTAIKASGSAHGGFNTVGFVVKKSNLLDGIEEKCDILLANLTADILKCFDFSRNLAPRGFAVVSGILASRVYEMEDFYRGSFEIVGSHVLGEWGTLVLRAKN